MPWDVDTSSTIQKAIAVLEVVAASSRAINIPDIATEIGLPRQTVHRIVTQLTDIAMLRRDPGRDRYFIGDRFSKLALNALTMSSQRNELHSVLTDLVDQIGETCNLGILDGTDVVYLDRVECHWPLSFHLKAGSRVKAYPTAIGKLLLAHLDDRTRVRTLQRIEFQKITDTTIVDEDQVEAHLAEIRNRGYSLNDQEDYVGLVAIAVPVRGDNDKIVAGLGIHAPVPRLSIEQLPSLLSKMYTASETIGKILTK